MATKKAVIEEPPLSPFSKKPYPFPEILEDGLEWIVEEGSTGTNTWKKKMMVPLAVSPTASNVRAFELARAKWCRNTVTSGDIDASLMRSVEDLWIIHKLKIEARIDIAKGREASDLTLAFRKVEEKKGEIRSAVRFLIERIGTEEFSKHSKVFSKSRASRALKSAFKIAIALNSFINNCPKPLNMEHLKETYRLAELWISEAESALYQQKKKEERKSELASDELSEGKLRPSKVRSMLEELIGRGLAMRAGEGATQTVPWGKMNLEQPPLVSKLKRKMMARVKRPAQEGVFIKDVSRFCTDQKIFGNLRRQLGGGVLIDASGSMALSSSSIKRMVDAAPALAVAVYSGTGGIGVCREVARNGRMIAEGYICSPYGSGNIIDGPALEFWLGKQTTPRIWVSDFGVTGVGDQSTAWARQEAVRICKKFGIIRVGNVQEACELFRRIERGLALDHPSIRKLLAKKSVA